MYTIPVQFFLKYNECIVGEVEADSLARTHNVSMFSNSKFAEFVVFY